MSQEKTCPQCGVPLPADAAEGLCPACLLKRGLEANTVGYTQEPPAGRWTPPAVDQLAGRFPELEILELIGRGGMGAVYKARQKNLDRLVALKILPPEIGKDADFAQRFAREAQALAKLNHPNIVAIYDFGQREEYYFFLMEFVDGLSLRQLLNTGSIAPREALAIVPQICEALQYAHDHGIIHRDIKPENILLNRQGHVKIADFGLAKLMAGNGQPSVTATEQVMGTPHYMAPEQAEHPQRVDHRADIYALGVVFYQMLTGELPLGKFAPPSQKVLVDVRLDDVVLKALEKEPDRRYQQASQVKTEVETIASTPAQNASAAPPASPPPPPTGNGATPDFNGWRGRWTPLVVNSAGRRMIYWPGVIRYMLLAVVILVIAGVTSMPSELIAVFSTVWASLMLYGFTRGYSLPLESLYTFEQASHMEARRGWAHPTTGGKREAYAATGMLVPPAAAPAPFWTPRPPRPPRPIISVGSALALLLALTGVGVGLVMLAVYNPLTADMTTALFFAGVLLAFEIPALAMGLIWSDRAGLVTVLLALAAGAAGIGWTCWRIDESQRQEYYRRHGDVYSVLTSTERRHLRSNVERELQAILANRLHDLSIDYDDLSVTLSRDARSASIHLQNPRTTKSRTMPEQRLNGSLRAYYAGVNRWRVEGRDDLIGLDFQANINPGVDIGMLALIDLSDFQTITEQQTQDDVRRRQIEADLVEALDKRLKNSQYRYSGFSSEWTSDNSRMVLHLHNCERIINFPDGTQRQPVFGAFQGYPLSDGTWVLQGMDDLGDIRFSLRRSEVMPAESWESKSGIETKPGTLMPAPSTTERFP